MSIQSKAGMMHRSINKENTYQFLTDVNSILVSGEDTNGEFCVVHCAVKKDDGPPLHLHEQEDESFYILEGEVEMTIGEKVIVAKAAEYVFAPRGIPHTFKVKSDKAKFLVTAYPAGFDSFVKELGVPYEEGMEDRVGPPTPEGLQRLLEVAQKYHISFPGL
ncbi:quercetin 2,3-dioxygenase [Cohnella sp. JJ-181]|uniref:quercetin 2,3-dioxygenase n=1 Tax=Cohnella rhizoplanae TaxID=2974897 RepID=UPI0022FFBCB9|nr:quercetin 2,3-dioxygenase [Cohnella sp. JJ-181]CAI6083018.1 hypothetical protein COHCIP112018_03844 [Cohnella sp. JJ-181]